MIDGTNNASNHSTGQVSTILLNKTGASTRCPTIRIVKYAGPSSDRYCESACPHDGHVGATFR